MIPHPAAFLLVPASAHYHPGDALVALAGFELHHAPVPDRRPAWRIMPARVADLRAWTGPSLFSSMPEPIELHRVTHVERERFTPYERRRRARRHGKGRRRATPVPMAREWSVGVYAAQGTPEGVARRLLAGLILAPALTVWRCPRWRCGADIWRRP